MNGSLIVVHHLLMREREANIIAFLMRKKNKGDKRKRARKRIKGEALNAR